MKTTHTIIRFIALVVLLTAGYTMAQATVSSPVIFEGRTVTIGSQSQYTWRIQGFLGMASSPSGSVLSGTSQTFNNKQVISGANRVTINGTLNFAEASDFTDVTTGSEVTLIFESSNYWFYGATVKTLSGSKVSGCSASVSSDSHTITVTIPSGKTFGNVYLDFVSNPPMTNENTTVTVPTGDYWVSDYNHKPKPEPTVVYGNTTLVKDTDYTLSWSNNSSAGTGTVTVTGIGNYAGTATGTFPIRWAKYYVHFDKNHDAATGTMNNQPFTYHTAQTLTANAFSCFGYDFAGWSTTPNGAVAYPDQQSVNNLSVNDGETINLYVKWMPSWTGEGSQNSPYMITNPSQLVKLANDVNGGNAYSDTYFKIGNDIDMAGVPFDGIGNSSTAFAGTFDGDMKRISNLTINSSDSYKGLFGVVTGTVRNVFLDGASITCTGDYGGVLAGQSDNGSFSNNYYHNCTLTKDGNTATTNIGFGGGIGDGNNCQIVYKLIIGDNVTIYNAHNVSVVIGTDTYGVADWSAYFRLSDGVDPGYSASFHYNDGTVHDLPYNSAQNYYYLNSTAQDVEVSVTLTDVWGIDSGADGTQDHPYMITTTDGLDLLANMVNGTHGYTFEVFTNKFFKLGADITYNTEGLGTSSNYNAIGGYIEIMGIQYSRIFQGTFDGDNKTISGLRINDSSRDYQGLFGWVDGSSVKNVVLANSVIKGKLYIGGIVGEAIRSTVSNCRVVSGDIIGHSRTGGITGDNSSFSIVSNCRVENGVKINTTEIRGGIVGYNSGVVSGCISSATFVGTSSYSGGITGSGDGGIKDCLFTGTINGSSSGSIYGGYIDYILTNNYYNYTTDGAYGIPYNDVDGARRAYTITLGENIALAGNRTAYNTSGLTAIGTTALSYNDGTTTTIYSGEGQTVTLAYTGTVPTTSTLVYSVNGTAIEGNSFQMPAGNVTVSATATIPTGTFSYIDADGNPASHEAIVLCDATIAIGSDDWGYIGVNDEETWYIVKSNYTFDGHLGLKALGTVNLILADGATLTVNGDQYGIQSDNLYIYGQSEGSGTIVATLNDTSLPRFAIRSKNLVINGGTININLSKGSGIKTLEAISICRGSVNVSVPGKGYAINASTDIVITGGVVNATADMVGYGLYSDGCNITISGGTINTSGITISAQNTITLGYTTSDDRITPGLISTNGTVVIAEGQTMTDGTDTYSGTLTRAQKSALIDKTLWPYIAPDGTLTLVQGTRDGVTAWWGTFFDSANNYTLPEGAAAYTMDGNHNLYRLGDNGRTIPKGKAVVVIATEAARVTPATSPATATIVLTSAGTEELSIADHTPGDGGNILQGSNVSVTVTDGKIAVGSEQKSVRVLGVVSGVVGFYPFATTFTGTIPAHKVFY